jgi:putative DNA-invertase from lambdoid prophage Rac
MPRAALYHRVSTVDQDPSLARGELRAAALARGLEIVIDSEETGSGARNNRPGLLRIVQAAQRGLVDVVLVWKLDRWGRSALDVLHNIRTLTDAGVRFVAVSQGLDVRAGGDPMSQLVVTMLAAVAEFERDLVRERTRLGIARARAAGKHLGRPRVGPAPDPSQVAHWRELGASWAEVARMLGCSIWAAREAAKKGCSPGARSPVDNRAAG